MLLETLSERFAQPMSTDFASTFPTIVPTLTEPVKSATRWIVDLGVGGQCSQNAAMILPYGTGADGATFLLRSYGWTYVGDTTIANQRLWIPVPLATYTCTIDASSPGISGSLLGTTKLFCKTLLLTKGNESVSVETVSFATAGLIAHFMLAVKGAKKLELTFDTNSSATGMNALYRLT